MLSQSSIVDYTTPYRPIEPWVLGIDQTVRLPAQVEAEQRQSEAQRAAANWAQQHGFGVSEANYTAFLWIGAAAVLLFLIARRP